MMQDFRDQAERFGTRFITDDATRIELSDEDGGVHVVHVGDQQIRTRAVVLAMGAEPKKLGVPGEDELAARGVSYCATCDAAFFRGADTIVVGGGDTAMEDATFLAKFAGKVYVVHRRDDFRASAIMLQRAKDTENIELLTPYVVQSFEPAENGALGEGHAREHARREHEGARRDRHASSRSATAPTHSWWGTSSTWTTRATCWWTAAPRAPSCPACSRRATSRTACTARP